MKMKKTLVSLLAAAALALPASAAFASIAANTQIVNQASLSYNDGAATRTATAAVTVTVSLVPGVPEIALGPANSTSYVGPATTLRNTFFVTNSGNGPDTFTLATVITDSRNTNNGTAPTAVVASPAAPATLSLGGTITVGGSSTTAIKVPSDGTADNIVNGIAGGASVVIAGELRTVQSVSDPGLNGVATINLSSALTSAPGAGVVVGEQKTVLVDVTAGAIQTVGQDVTVSKNLTVTSTNLASATLTSASLTDTFTSGLASLKKYVRNLTTGQVGTTQLTHNGADYYQYGINAAPGDTLEYILVSSNGGTAPVTQAVVTDVLPTAFVTLKKGYSTGTKEFTYESDAGAQSFLSAANDADNAKYVSGTITVNVGTGATATNGTNLGGAIDAGKSVFVYYQVTVNN